MKEGGSATSVGVLTPPLKWHVDGGKHYLAARIVALMPPHRHYVEPFAGGLAVLLAKDPEGVSEVVNDVDAELTNFWAVLRDEQLFIQFRRQVEAVPFSESEYAAATGEDFGGLHPNCGHCRTRRAVMFFVRCRQSLAGRMEGFAPLSRTRTRRGMNEQASAWIGAVEGLPAVHARLRRVVVLCRDALEVIHQQDGPDTLFYLDPPYLAETRTAPRVYRHELTECEHENILRTLRFVRGRFVLSGYPHPLYDAAARENGWHAVDLDVPNNAAGGTAKRRMTERLWLNFVPGSKETP